MDPDDFGSMMITLLTRSMIDDHFNGFFVGGVSLRAETNTGSRYHIDIEAGSQAEEYSDPATGIQGTFWIRNGSVLFNGTKFTGYVGYSMEYGCFVVLDDQKNLIRRSSSIARVVQLDSVS